MVKPLTFKGDKPKKRKHRPTTHDTDERPKTRKTGPTTTAEAQEDEAQARSANNKDDDNAADDQSWVSADGPSDIDGPVVFVLPSDTPSCIASDANGTVFASRLENMIDDDPGTAEPHDVRQVWVATRVAGTESLSFKGHHGKYVYTLPFHH